MKMFRRIGSALIAASLVLSLAACSGPDGSGSHGSKPKGDPAASAVVGTEENPVPFGEWGEVPFYNAYVTEYLKAYIRMTGVYRQGTEMYDQIMEEVTGYIEAGEAENVAPSALEQIESCLWSPHFEGVIVQYEAYIPEMKTLENGLPAPEIQLEPYSEEKISIDEEDPGNTYTLTGCVDLPSADYRDGQQFFPENTYTFYSFHVTVKGFYDYVLRYEHRDVFSQDPDKENTFTILPSSDGKKRRRPQARRPVILRNKNCPGLCRSSFFVRGIR